MIGQMENQRATNSVVEMKPRTCPECGGLMAEVERVSEKGYFYIWYRCRQQNCSGQWLEKKAAFQSWEWRNR